MEDFTGEILRCVFSPRPGRRRLDHCDLRSTRRNPRVGLRGARWSENCGNNRCCSGSQMS